MAGTASYLNHEQMFILAGTDMTSTMTLLGIIGEGDVTLTISQDWADETIGSSTYVKEKYFKGAQAYFEATLAEIGNIDTWAAIFLLSEVQEDTASPPLNRIVSNSSTAAAQYFGQKATSHAKIWCLRPVTLYTDATTETARDIVFPRGIAMPNGAMELGIDSAHVAPFRVDALYDPADTLGEHLWYRGITTPTGAWTAV